MNQGAKTILVIFCLLSLLGITLWGLGDALFPLMISFAMAYLFFPLIQKLEAKGLKRHYSVIGVFTVFLLFFLFALVLIVPGLISELQIFIKELPQSTSIALERVDKILSGFGIDIGLSREEIRTYIIEHASEVSSGFLKGVSQGVFTAFSGVVKWFLSILNLFLIPLFFFYVINDFEKISTEIVSFIPNSVRPKLKLYMGLTNRVLSGYIRGQLMVALVLGCLYGLGLFLIGLKFGFLIGFASGLLGIVPYAGFAIGITTALLTGLASHEGSSLLVGIVVVFVLVQSLEGSVITPRLVGNKVGLGPLSTILALIVGGNFFGLAGMLVAIPVAAIAKSILGELKQEYLKLELYK